MEPVAALWRSLSLEGSVLFSAAVENPWDLVLEAGGCPRFHIVADGETLCDAGSVSGLRLGTGTVVLTQDDYPHRLYPPEGQASAKLVCGSIGMAPAQTHPLFALLPMVLQTTIGAEDFTFWRLVDAMICEATSEHGADPLMSDRLCEAMLTRLLRQYLKTSPELEQLVTAWRDPCVSRALTALHADPALAWSMSKLAELGGLSRSAFAARFQELVGLPPMTYLTRWRMHLAKQLLQEPGARIYAVARRVGYHSDTAFMRAFKQHTGQSPSAFRRAEATTV